MKLNGAINPGLVFDGLYFRSNGACCQYKSLGAWKRPQWRRNNPDEFVLLSEVEPSIASENKTDVNPSLKAPDPYPQATPANEKIFSATRPVARPIEYRITKTEVLNRARVALESGESLRNIAERLAGAKEDFHASQREIGRALGRSASWVNRLLAWLQSGYKLSSPFGPTTRAGRAARRKGPGGCGSPKTPDDDGQASLVPQCSPADQPASRAASVNAGPLGGPTQTDLVPSAEASTTETQPPETEITTVEDPAPTPDQSPSREPEKRVSPARKANAAQKLSPERCESFSKRSRNIPFSVMPPPKQAFIPKHLLTGCDAARTTSNGTTCSGASTNIADAPSSRLVTSSLTALTKWRWVLLSSSMVMAT
jgi:hypothetical protein